MKKSLLALAVLGAFAATAQAQSSVTIYGIVDAGITMQSKSTPNNNKLFALTSGGMSGSRLGFKGTEDLGGGLKANFVLESGFNTDTGALNSQEANQTNLFRRTSTVGLSGAFGSVNLGRQTDFAYSGVNGGTAVYSTQGYMGIFTDDNGSAQARLAGSRTDNSIRYDMPNFNGLTGGVMYGFGEQTGAGSAGQSYSAGLKYDNGPISFGGSYYQSKFGTTPSDSSLNGFSSTGAQLPNGTGAGNTALKTFTLGASYNFGSSLLYGNWSRVKMATATAATGTFINPGFTTNASNSANDKLDLYEIGYNYDLTSSLKLLTGISHTRASFVTGASAGNINMVAGGVDYFLSKRTDLYAMASYYKASGITNPLSTGTQSATPVAAGTVGSAYLLGVGIRHAF